MIPKFSVKKPLTIFVGVIIVLILGVVSYTRMTPDLLPNINLPYAVIVTTYPGATPEEVETEVTKPLEQAAATLDNIEDVTSTSSENASMVMLSFSEDVNMDTVTAEIREKINSVSGNWNEKVSTPYIMKVNPNIMPVVVAALNRDETDIVDLTELLDSELMNQLEGIEGVASVSVSGNIEESINVGISQAKIDTLNDRIRASLDKKFDEAEQEINEQSDEIDKGLAEVESKQTELDSQMGQLQSGQRELENQVSGARSQLLNTRAEIEAAMGQINAGISEIDTNLGTLNNTKTELVTVQTAISTIQSQIASIDDMIVQLEQAAGSYSALLSQKTALEEQLGLLEENEENAGLIAELQTQLEAVQAQIDAIDATLADLGIGIDGIPAKIAELQASKAQAQAVLDQSLSFLEQNGIDPASLDTSIQEVDGAIAQLQSSRNTLTQTRSELDAGLITVEEALAELNRQQQSGMMQISSGIAQITAGQSALTDAQSQLTDARTQLDEATKDFEVQKEAAYKAANLKITMEMVAGILTAQNFTMPAGYITEDDVQTLVKIGDKIDSINELENLLLFDTGISGVGRIYLKDVADINVLDNADEMYAKLNGEQGILLSFTKQSTYSTAVVSENIQEKFEQISEEYEGVYFTALMDQGDYIYVVVNSVLENLVLGALFAIVILLFFLKDIRPTLVIGASIPISLLVAIVLMYFSGVTLNVISLSGLAVGVGMLVDNSVVVIENIYRIRSEGASAAKASVYGAVQVTGAIIASTLTTVCVFLPIVFVEGITRQLFTDMALTIGYSLVASLFVAITLVPAMASKTLRRSKPKEHKLFDKILNLYGKVASASLRHKWVVLALSVVLLVVSVYFSVQKGLIFMPSMSGSQISVSVALDDEEAGFADQARMMDAVSEKIMEIEDVETVGSMIDSSGGGLLGMGSGSGGGGSMIIYAILSENAEHKDAEVSKMIVESCEELECEVTAQGAMDLSSYMTSLGGSGVTMNIYGDDMDDLIETAAGITEIMEDVEGIETVTGDIQNATPEIRIVVNKNQAMEKGLTTAQVYQSIAAAITETATPTTIQYNDINEDVIVHNPLEGQMDLQYLKDFVIETTDAKTGEAIEVNLSDIVSFQERESLSSISRENQRRYVTVSGVVADGYNVNLVTNAVQDELEKYLPAKGIQIESTGENETIMEAMEQLALMAILAIAIIYLIMVIQFQSLLSPFIVMFTIPLAFTGGFAMLYITGFEISVISVIGFIMLAGIIVNNGIVLVDYVNQLRRGGMEKRAALVEACKTRMRPVLMTTITTVLGLVFMAIGFGSGAELMQPIAITCIGGLIYGTLMTLFVVPALYDIFNRKELTVIDIDADDDVDSLDIEKIAEGTSEMPQNDDADDRADE